MKLSVAMITYNQERFIGQAIESVLAQKVNFDFEIIIGEDCSADGTRSVVMDLHRRYPDRIVLILRPRNIGPMRNIESTSPPAAVSTYQFSKEMIIGRRQIRFRGKSISWILIPSAPSAVIGLNS